jgi:hypothetical protein
MSGLDPKIYALRYAAKHLHSKRIVEHILTNNFWQATGKAPAYAVSSGDDAS